MPGPKARSVVERLESKLDRSGDCHLWMPAGSINNMGYPMLRVGSAADGSRRTMLVSRIVLEQKLGRPIGEKLEACHTCDNPLCCNPDHLYEGTRSQNTKDAHRRGRVRPPLITERDPQTGRIVSTTGPRPLTDVR